jgi:hypothetical protein
MHAPLFSLFLGLAALSASPVPAAHASECYPEEQAKRYVADFQVDLDSFPGGIRLCDPGSPALVFFRTLDFLRATKISEKKQPPLVRGILPTDYYSYLKGRVRLTSGPLQRNPAGGDAVASLSPTGGHLILGDSFFASSLVFRASTLVHEARHSDGDFGHVTCTQGHEKGSRKGCDPDEAADGTYSAQIEYLARIFLFAPGVPDSLRIAAKGLGLYLLQNKFNRSPITGRKAVVLVDSNGAPTLFDGRKALSYSLSLGESDLFARDRNFNVVPHDRGKPSFLFDPYLPSHIPGGDGFEDPELLGKVFVLYNTRWPQGRRSALRDAFRFGTEGRQALLFPDHIEIFEGAENQRLELGGVAAARFVRDLPCEISGEAQLVLQDSARRLSAVATDGGEFHPLDCPWPKGALDFARLNEGALLLLADGTAARAGGEKPEPVAELAGRKFVRMLRLKEPFFWEMLGR